MCVVDIFLLVFKMISTKLFLLTQLKYLTPFCISHEELSAISIVNVYTVW